MSRVIALVNGAADSAAGSRARALLSRCQTEFFYRTENKSESLRYFLSKLEESRSCETVYVMDLAWSGVLAAVLHSLKRRRMKWILDTGDAVFELAKSMGRSLPGLVGSWGLEQLALRSCHQIVVRGHGHLEFLKHYGIDVPAVVIPDGVDVDMFQPANTADTMRSELHIDSSSLVVGVVGASMWTDRLGIGYGWDLVEAVGQLRHRDVVGVLIGGGDGVGHLKKRAQDLGVTNRLRFVDRVPLEQLPAYVNGLDVCLSTQTNNWVGRVRTTGKLPLYLSCDRFILASRVGEAERVLEEEMLVPYDGVVDREYPARLAERIDGLVKDRHRLRLEGRNRRRALEHFDYRKLSLIVGQLIEKLEGESDPAG